MRVLSRSATRLASLGSTMMAALRDVELRQHFRGHQRQVIVVAVANLLVFELVSRILAETSRRLCRKCLLEKELRPS